MSLSTLSFNTLEDAQQFYADNLDITQGVVLDVELGSLPESSLVIQTGVAVDVDSSVPSTDQPAALVPPAVQVAVFEAPVPFSVSFTGDDIDPAAVIAAAEALFAAPAGNGTASDRCDDDRLDLPGCRDGPIHSLALLAESRQRCAIANTTRGPSNDALSRPPERSRPTCESSTRRISTATQILARWCGRGCPSRTTRRSARIARW